MVQAHAIRRYIYSRCFAGKAKRGVACVHCLSDAHLSDRCPDNPARAYRLVWYGCGPGATSVVLAPRYSQQLKVYYLFNAKRGLQGHLCALQVCARMCDVQGRPPMIRVSNAKRGTVRGSSQGPIRMERRGWPIEVPKAGVNGQTSY